MYSACSCLVLEEETMERGETELHLAVWTGDLKLVEELLDNGATVDECNSVGDTPLHVAAVFINTSVRWESTKDHELVFFEDIGHQETRNAIVDKLLDKGASLDIQNHEGNTPLHIAVALNNEQLVIKLLNSGANMYVVNKRDQIPLDISRFERLSSILIDKALMKPTSEEVKLLLHSAVRCNRSALVDQLLDRGVMVDLRNDQFETPLHVAAWCNQCDMVDKLLDRGANIEAQDRYGGTPLFYATASSNILVITRLISRGANPNVRYYKGNTPLHISVLKNDTTLLEDLLERGWFVDVRNDEGLTPLHFAAFSVLDTIARMLILRGADVNARSKRGETPLHFALVGEYHVNNDEMDALPSPITQYREHIKKLSWIKFSKQKDFVDMLIERHADIEAKTNEGDTPLHTVSKIGHTIMVHKLLCDGADFNALTHTNQTPYQVALTELVKKTIALHIFKLSLAGFSVNNCDFEEDFVPLWVKYELLKELDRIKKTKVYENASLNIIFAKHRNPYYMSNKELVMALERKLVSSDSDFFHYCRILKNTFVKSKSDFHLFNLATHAFASLLKAENLELPIEIIETILQYLDDSERCELLRIESFMDFNH